jgi:hypothetical protein
MVNDPSGPRRSTSGDVRTRPPRQEQPAIWREIVVDDDPPERSDPQDCPPPLRDRRRGTACAAAATALLVERDHLAMGDVVSRPRDLQGSARMTSSEICAPLAVADRSSSSTRLTSFACSLRPSQGTVAPIRASQWLRKRCVW